MIHALERLREVYGLHGKAALRTLPKQYIVDIGLRSYLMGYCASDAGRVFESAVYLRLLHDGWPARVGKLYQKEVDVIASAQIAPSDNML